jgi:hypothetical protein
VRQTVIYDLLLHLQQRGKFMSSRGKATLVESTLLLALMGILAGAIGGLAVGAATSPKTASTSPR